MAVKNEFKEKLRAGTRQYGHWVMTGSEVVSEALACLDYDFQVLDLEHIGELPPKMPGLLRSAFSGGTPAVVRMPSQDPIMIKQYLDLGAHSLMFPFVENAAMAQALVQAALYPPRGMRGMARLTRATRFATISDYTSTVADAVCLVAQLETPQAMENALEIAAVPGISALFVGPGDLSTNMGKPAAFADASFREYMGKTLNLCREHGVPVGTVCPTAELALWALDQGCCYAAVGSDLAWLMQTGRSVLAELRASSS